MYIVYILESKSGKYYIGMTKNIDDRLRRHNSGATKFTKPYIPWKVIYQEKYLDKQLAWLREKKIKAYKSGNAFKKLINQHGEVA